MSETENQRDVKSSFPYAHTAACVALKEGLTTSRETKSKSLRAVARELNYKQPVVLSHMAHGRIPVPIERAEEIAVALGMDPKNFMKLVLAQRYPDLDLDSLSEHVGQLGLIDSFPNVAFEASGRTELTDGQQRVIREVMRDTAAPERWLTPHEVGVVALIRKMRPSVETNGLNHRDMERLEQALS